MVPVDRYHQWHRPFGANSRVWGARGAGGELNSPSWLLDTALLLLASGHSGLGVSLRPCLAVGHCLAPCDPVSDAGVSLGPESLPASLVPSSLTSSLSRHAAL